MGSDREQRISGTQLYNPRGGRLSSVELLPGMDDFTDFFVSLAIKATLLLSVFSAIFCVTALIGLCMPSADDEARRKFRRLGGYSLPVLIVSAALFWWVSHGATIPFSGD